MEGSVARDRRRRTINKMTIAANITTGTTMLTAMAVVLVSEEDDDASGALVVNKHSLSGIIVAQ